MNPSETLPNVKYQNILHLHYKKIHKSSSTELLFIFNILTEPLEMFKSLNEIFLYLFFLNNHFHKPSFFGIGKQFTHPMRVERMTLTTNQHIL